MQQPKLITISGPTAVGKTAFSVALATFLECPVLSSDARQFYKEMRIGTAVPTNEEMQGVPHYFIQHKSIHEPYSVGAFEKEALKVLDEQFKTHDVVILVGGSNLYTDAIVNGLDVFPKVSDEIISMWQRKFDINGLKHIQQALFELDPAYYSVVDIQNPMRLLRALAVCSASGKPYSSFLGQPKEKRRFDTVSIELIIPRETLYERINKRVDLMVNDGLVEEVKNLVSYKHLNALQTVGYRELFPYLEGNQSLNKSIEEIKKNTRRFAKRQLTWMRNHPCMHQLPHDTMVNQELLIQLGLEKGI